MTSKAIHVKDFRTEIPGKLSDDRLTWYFPLVTTTTTLGQESNWKIYVRVVSGNPPTTDSDPIPIEDSFFDSKPMNNNLAGWIKVDTGIGDTVSVRVPTLILSGKKPKTKSATNVFTQALRDAYGLYNKQAKKASTATINIEKGISTELLPPMLAQTLAEQTTRPTISDEDPAFIQPKFNGVRAVTTLNELPAVDGKRQWEVIMYSRRKNLYPGFNYIKNEVKDILISFWEKGVKLYLDGELYKHGIALQDISGHARREDKAEGISLDYMVYDCFVANDRNLNVIERRKILDEVFGQLNGPGNVTSLHTKMVPTDEVYMFEDIDTLYKLFLSQGYEGAMVRLNKPYSFGFNEHHSDVLLKIKPTFDGEYEVTGWETGKKGKAAQALMIICSLDGKTFPVTPALKLPERIALANKMATVEPNGKDHFTNHWKGKKIIVFYDELSKSGLPQRARTKLEIRTWD